MIIYAGMKILNMFPALNISREFGFKPQTGIKTKNFNVVSSLKCFYNIYFRVFIA